MVVVSGSPKRWDRRGIFHPPGSARTISGIYVVFFLPIGGWTMLPIPPFRGTISTTIDFPNGLCGGYGKLLTKWDDPPSTHPTYKGHEKMTPTTNQTMHGYISKGNPPRLTNKHVHSLKLTKPLKMDGWNTTFPLGRPIFRGEPLVSGRVSVFDLIPPKMSNLITPAQLLMVQKSCDHHLGCIKPSK